MIMIIVLFFSYVCSIPIDAAPECTSSSKAGSVCTLHPDQMRPSQFGYGGLEVKCKKDRFESFTSSELKKYLESADRRVDIIIGEKSGYYVLDGHHMSRALLDSDVKDDEKVIYCNIVDNWSDLSDRDFWMSMVEDNRVWLYDEKGVAPLAPEHLSTSLDGMLDDPFRTLAWMVQDAGGYLKTGTPFEDFLWANFLRDNIDLNSSSLIIKDSNRTNIRESSFTWCEVRPNSEECLSNQASKLKKALPVALVLSRSESASSLPGYGKGVIDPPDCGAGTYLDFINDITKIMN